MPGTEGPPRWLSADEQEAWRAVVHLSQLLCRQLDRDLNAHGRSRHDYEVLVELSEAPGMRLRMTELADATSQARSRRAGRAEPRGERPAAIRRQAVTPSAGRDRRGVRPHRGVPAQDPRPRL